MIKFTKHNLKKLEELFDQLSYTIRYERGNFNSGYCIVENKRIAVVNKFYDVQGRIGCLLEILQKLDVQAEQLDEKNGKFYRELKKSFAPQPDIATSEETK